MNQLASRKRYLTLHRKRIRREMDAMGYGQSRVTIPHFERAGRKSSTARAISAIAAAVLSLV